MIRVFQMIFAPEGAWWKIAEKERNFLFVLFVESLPLIAVSIAIEALGLERLGESVGEFGRRNIVQDLIIRYAEVKAGLNLAFLFGGSWFLLSVAKSFGARVNFSHAFGTIAYGASPIFLIQALDALPQVNTWLCWGIGAALSIRSLYHGVAINMKPEQTKGMGLYIVAVFIVCFLSGLAHFLAWSILHSKTL